jgi:cephalosporin hydroxylase
MPASTPYRDPRKDNKPRGKWAGKFGLPRKAAVPLDAPAWSKLKAIFKHRKLFWSAGWEAVAGQGEHIIHDADYEPRLRATLGEYLNWYFTAKSFLHSIDWMGIPTRKMVTDVWVYQEIIFETKPDLIIEIGSFYGGSTLFLAQMQELLGDGTVLSIDVSHDYFLAEHSRISKITADCSDPAVLAQVRELAAGKKVMLIHDGDHTAAAVERDLRLYAEFVTPGMYLIIEDGVVDLLNPKYSKVGGAYPEGGPLKATRAVYAELEKNFELDMRRERFILTTNPNGYWLRKGGEA